MNETYGTKKFGADKIALLGFLGLAVLIAHFIIVLRSAIVLTEPIDLNYTGLSVSVPCGNGWKSEKKWKHRSNGYVLTSVFVPGAGNITAVAYCRYLLAAPKTDSEERIKQKVANVDGEIVQRNQHQADSLIIDWARVKIAETMFEMLFGTVQLPNNRRFDIEVRQNTIDSELAENVFKRIAESLKFKDNSLLNSGSEIVAGIKRTGIDRFLYNRNQQKFFLVKDSARRPIGFTMDVLIDSASSSDLNIQAASLFYLGGRDRREQATLFQSDYRFDRFEWKSETGGIGDRVGVEMTLNPDGQLTVREADRQDKKKIYNLGTAALPELLLDFVFKQVLDSDYEKIIVDVIEADGKITPVLVSWTTQNNKNTAAQQSQQIESDVGGDIEDESGYVLEMELLSGKGLSQKVYLDERKEISKRLLYTLRDTEGTEPFKRRKITYILERTDLDSILKQFPERAGRIMRNIEIFEKEKSQL